MKTYNTIADLKLMVEDELLRLANGKMALDTSVGICHHLDWVFPELGGMALGRTLSVGWPFHSGDRSYPVPVRYGVAGVAFYSHDNLWADTPYGDMRRGLCAYLAGRVRHCSDSTFRKLLKEGVVL